MQNRVKNFFIVILIALLFLPATQYLFNVPEIKNMWLAGKTLEAPKPKFNISSWLNESYQTEFSAYLEANAGFRPWLVRFTNEWQFRLFKDADNNVIVGKENRLFLKESIEMFEGRDLTNYDTLLARVVRSKRLQQLLDSAGKKSLFIIAPTKAAYDKEYIPNRYIKSETLKNNYQLLKSAFEKQQIESIDLYCYFLSQKEVSNFPLYPQYGTHWSLYGGFIAMDSIVHYLQERTTWSPQGYKIDSIQGSTKPRGTDKDLLDLMNVFSEPTSQLLAYPVISKTNSSQMVRTPNILVIGDSYMWTLYQSGIMPLIAGSNTRYWYYGNTVFNFETKPTGIEIKNLNMGEELKKADVILFVSTNQVNYDFNMTEKFISALESAGYGTN